MPFKDLFLWFTGLVDLSRVHAIFISCELHLRNWVSSPYPWRGCFPTRCYHRPFGNQHSLTRPSYHLSDERLSEDKSNFSLGHKSLPILYQVCTWLFLSYASSVSSCMWRCFSHWWCELLKDCRARVLVFVLFRTSLLWIHVVGKTCSFTYAFFYSNRARAGMLKCVFLLV